MLRSIPEPIMCNNLQEQSVETKLTARQESVVVQAVTNIQDPLGPHSKLPDQYVQDPS